MLLDPALVDLAPVRVLRLAENRIKFSICWDTFLYQRWNVAPTPSYDQGAVLALVTWAQRDDPRWFGAGSPTDQLQ